MKKRIWKVLAAIPLALAAVMLTVLPVSAAEIRGYDDVIVASGDVVDDDLYIAGNRIVVNGTVNGDLFVAGSTVIIDGTINGDVVALASTLTVGGTITGSARVAASTITIDGNIGQDLMVAGSTVDVQEAAEIGRDVVFGGSTVTIESIIHGDLTGIGKTVNLLQTINGDATIEVNNLTIGSQATIQGSLVYTSDNEATIRSGAVISGEVTRKLPVEHRWDYDWVVVPFTRTWGHVFSYLMVMVVGIVLVLVAPGKSTGVANKIRNTPLKSLGWGALIVFVTPIMIVLSILTIIGIPLGLIGILAYGIILFLSQLAIGMFIGHWIIGRLGMEENRGTLILALFIGFTIMTLLKLIPFVGFVIWGITVLFGTGAIALLFERKRKKTGNAEVIEALPEPTA